MRSFTVIYVKTVREDKVIQARNEKEARAKFEKTQPEVRVLDVQEWNEGMENFL